MENEFDVFRLFFRFSQYVWRNNVIVTSVAKIKVACIFAGVVSHDLNDSLVALVAVDQFSVFVSARLLGRHQAKWVVCLTVLVLRNTHERMH